MGEKLKEQLKLTRKYLRNALDVAVPFLCLGVVVQLIVGESLLVGTQLKTYKAPLIHWGKAILLV